MNHWKKWTWAYDHLKLVICQGITSKNTRPRWVNTWARGTVRWYWSAGALFWQLSIDHNIDVQLVFPWAPKLARKCESRHWFPCGADGRSYGHVITKFSRMGRLPHFLTYGAPPTLARFAPGWSSAINQLSQKIVPESFDAFFLNLCNFKNFKSRRMSTDHNKITFATKYLRMSQVR